MISYYSLEDAAKANNCKVSDFIFDEEMEDYKIYHLQVGMFEEVIVILK